MGTPEQQLPQNTSPEEQLLETERGRFILDYRDIVLPNAIELIDISTVDEYSKIECKKIIGEGLNRAENKNDRNEVYDLANITIVKLLDFLREKDTERFKLFEALRNLILSARNSALGWQDKH